ncbi:MAG: hypothetical protein ACK4K7_02935 [Allosphingosinicella sp.]|uniref:hypothetical protein n=1 Tax=Allosphingosinicella sp. TaxID=2823234 RepID=UPI003920DB9D
MKALFTYSASERRAAMTAINLFFSALLGASLGAMSEMPLERYAMIIIVLVAAVSSIFVVAYSERKATILSTGIVLAALLAGTIWSPTLRLPEDMQRLSVALLIWVTTLVGTRYWPAAAPRESADRAPASQLLDEEEPA